MLDEGAKLKKKFDDIEYELEDIVVQFQVIELKKKKLSNKYKKLIRARNEIQKQFDRVEREKKEQALEMLQSLEKTQKNGRNN